MLGLNVSPSSMLGFIFAKKVRVQDQVQPVQVPVQAIVNHPADIQVDIRTFSRVSLSPIWKTSRKVRGQRVLALSRLPELWPTLEGEG